MQIHKGTVVTNTKTGKQYTATNAPYEKNGQLMVCVRPVSGKGSAHYMRVANLTVAK